MILPCGRSRKRTFWTSVGYMPAIPTVSATIHLKSGKKSGRTSGKFSDVESVNGKHNSGYKLKRTRIFGTLESYQKTERVQVFGARIRGPQSKSFLAKAASENKLSQKTGFFVEICSTDITGISNRVYCAMTIVGTECSCWQGWLSMINFSPSR